MPGITYACRRSSGRFPLRFYLLAALLLLPLACSSIDVYVTGKVTNRFGNAVPEARISMNTGSFSYSAVSGPDGYYTLRLSGIFAETSKLLELGSPYPNPFSHSVNIPFIISSTGDISISIYSMGGQKITDLFFPAVSEGSYRIVWDGCNASGAPVRQGFYVFAITFQGKTWSGRMIKAAGISAYSAGSMLEPVMMPPSGTVPDKDEVKIPVVTTVTCPGYSSIRLTDIVIRHDTIVDFSMIGKDALPFRIDNDHIAMNTETGYRSLFLKGINLGSSPPGYFPGEIAYAITPEMYVKWIKRIAEAGFNSIRVYTLHPPVFYETLSNYNYRNPDNPVLLFQGIWLGEVEDGSDPGEYDLIGRIPAFRNEIEEVMDCIHGNRTIAFRPGRAYGNYSTDASVWTAGYILGREISSQEVDSTNLFHASLTSFAGSQFSITGGSASEVFAARMLDETVTREYQQYGARRPVSMSSWPTLDPLSHPTEIHTDEDKAQIDIYKISGKNSNAGLFATYHAYPYYPNFISQQPSYQAYSDPEGPNSYLGYITDLKNHYPDIPLIIGEFGVPSSWGSAHQSFSSMDHGGYSETQQGEKNMRLMKNIYEAGCGGGFMFAWMDEWFKRTWIVEYLEAYGFKSGEITIPTRQLWHNLTSPEQNFGLLSFDQMEILPFISYQKNNPTGNVSRIEATNDNSYFYLNAELNQALSPGDTLMIAFDTYSSSLGESLLPNGKTLINRSEFNLFFVAGQDTALYQVTEAYDMNGLTPRFNLADHLKQKFKSTVSDGAPWVTMQWINDGFEDMVQDIGRMPAENSAAFSPGKRSVLAWNGNRLKVKVPWTLLYYFDPTQMKVIDGAVSYDGGWTFEINTAESDGIAVSVYYKGSVTSSTTRYVWNKWLVVPQTFTREKASLHVVEAGLDSFPTFVD
ncbi:MAG: T9SS type A sorting domain-containing protein [Bacteroidales bacterium]|nr:T9SS type A sorting domain-containing protein [Bacteroidales bacterium]